jgi:hypothetical protein
MEKYFISVSIPYLLLYLSGCYSMQEVTKAEFSQEHQNYPTFLVRTEKNEIIFQRGDYYLWQDTIYGQGTCRTLNNVDEPFDSSLGLTDVKEIQTEKFNLGGTIALASGIVVVIAGFVALAVYSTWSLDWGK